MAESQESQIKTQIITLLKCKARKKEIVGEKTINYTLDNDTAVIMLLGLIRDTLVAEIYEYLVPIDTEESEKKIREWVKIVYSNILPITKDKLTQWRHPKNEEENKIASQYFSLYDDFYAICAFRSLEMFALYMEFDLAENDKIFTYNLNCFKGYWYYANRMILDHSIKNIVKRCPTGYGKTYSNMITCAFIFGYDLNADIMYVCGNPGAVSDLSNKLVATMCKPRYAKVFKQYAKFKNDKGNIFAVCQMGGKAQPTRLRINGTNKGTSFLCFNKDTSNNGSRSMYHFYDDITDPKKGGNVAQNELDINAWKTEWVKRKYDDNRVFEVFSGTTRSLDDFISYHVIRLGEDDSKTTPRTLGQKYTTINEKTKSVFVKVPKIDFSRTKRGEITFPQKYSLEEALKDMANDPALFFAMDMQEPQPMEGCPFAYDNIMQYETLPKHDKGSACWASLDPARTGKNYCSMPIFMKIEDKHYLIDCVYQLKRTEDLLNDFIEKIIKHNITRLHVECNTSTSLKTLLEKMLKERGINSCTITESYTIKNKEDKIVNNEASIRNNIVFPKFGLFAQGSDMGKFMKWFTGYSYMAKNLFDDAPDSVAQYSERFINNAKTKATLHVVQRQRNY